MKGRKFTKALIWVLSFLCPLFKCNGRQCQNFYFLTLLASDAFIKTESRCQIFLLPKILFWSRLKSAHPRHILKCDVWRVLLQSFQTDCLPLLRLKKKKNKKKTLKILTLKNANQKQKPTATKAVKILADFRKTVSHFCFFFVQNNSGANWRGKKLFKVHWLITAKLKFPKIVGENSPSAILTQLGFAVLE